MSRLRVGDIEIDGSNVRIGAGDAEPVPSSSRRRPSIRALAILLRFPLPARAIGWFGGAAAIAGALTVIPSVLVGRVSHGLVLGGWLSTFGVACIAVASLKGLLESGRVDINRIALGDETRALLERARIVLSRDESHQTVTWIQTQTGWPEADVIRVLTLLRTRGELVEDLNDETGEFYYHVVPRGSSDLNARLDSLNKEDIL
jgi:hypothetical protein